MNTAVIHDRLGNEFTPKDCLGKWQVTFGANTFSGYDFALLIENRATKVSYQIEVGVTEDGRLCGQFTPDQGDNGPDALALFNMSPQAATFSDNKGGAKLVVTMANP